MACDTYVTNRSINAEYERKKELERRRKLRLLQVRQQSKDFSDKLRETIQAEELKIRTAALKFKLQIVRDKKEKELNKLKDVYGVCLKNIGSSHREAAKQPDINLIKELDAAQKSKEAALRGNKARKQQFAEKSVQLQKIQAPIEQKRETRKMEDMRSFFVSSLPKPPSGHKQSSRSQKKVAPTTEDIGKNLDILSEVPTNFIPPQATSYCLPGSTDSQTIPSKTSLEERLCPTSEQSRVKASRSATGFKQDNPPSSVVQTSCSCDYVVCSCHFTNNKTRRRSYSESTVSSERTTEAKKRKLRSRSCSPQSVRTLNYCSVGNVYESKEPNFATVKLHPKPSEVKVLASHPNTHSDILPLDENCKNKELHKKTEERCLKALQREKLKKDFLQLLQDLKNANRQKLDARIKSKSKTRVYQRERDVLAQNESKQKKLADAFEILLQKEKHKSRKNREVLTSVRQPSLDSSSPPTLNLATYQQINMERCRQVRHLVPEDETSRSLSPKTTEHNMYAGRRECLDQEQHHRGQHSSTAPLSTASTKTDERVCLQEKSCRGQHPSTGPISTVSTKTNEKDSIPMSYCQEEPQKKHKKPQKSNLSPDSGTSYYSLPEHLTPSQHQLLDELLGQVKKKSLNPELKFYIQKLLNMSRESIENLPSPRIDSGRQSPSVNVEESLKRVAELVNDYADRLNDLVNTFEVMDNCASPLQHLGLPERIAPDPPRPSPATPPTSPTMSKKPPPHSRDESPSSGISQIRSTNVEKYTPSEPSPTFQPRSDLTSSPLSFVPRNIQTPFGLSSNLLPDPKDIFQQSLSRISENPETLYPKSFIPADESPDKTIPPRLASRNSKSPDKGSDSQDDSTSWAFAGLPSPPVLPPDAPHIDDKVIYMEKLGYLPDEGSNELDMSNLSMEMDRLCKRMIKLRAVNHEDKTVESTDKVLHEDFDAHQQDEDIEGGVKTHLTPESPEQNSTSPEALPSPVVSCPSSNPTEHRFNKSLDGVCLKLCSLVDAQLADDSSFDLGDVSYPLNVERINKIKDKLSYISNYQYGCMLDVLQREHKFEDEKIDELLDSLTRNRLEKSYQSP